jgi:hypothetical protein
MNNDITAQATASRQIAQRLRASRRNCPTTAARRSAALLRLTVSAKVAFSDRTVEQASGLCREGWEGQSRRESRSCFAYYPILFSTSYSSICICLVCSGQSASILKMPVANNLLYLKAIGTLRREYERASRGRGKHRRAPQTQKSICQPPQRALLDFTMFSDLELLLH